MPVSQINHTGRKRLTSADVTLALHNEAFPLAFEITRLSLDRHKLPEDALVRLEAYQRTIYARFSLGTVGRIALPGKESLHQFSIPDGIRFRVKVTAANGTEKGKLLAAGSGIAPIWLDGGQESLLPVRPDNTLGQEVYRLSFDDGIVLLVNDKIVQWRELSRDPAFMALVYPTVLRLILNRILLSQEGFEEDSDEEWANDWIAFAKSHLKMSAPPRVEADGTGPVNEWIDRAVTSFCSKNGSYDGFSRRWDRGGHL